MVRRHFSFFGLWSSGIKPPRPIRPLSCLSRGHIYRTTITIISTKTSYSQSKCLGHSTIELDQKEEEEQQQQKTWDCIWTVKDVYGWYKLLISCLLSRQSAREKKKERKERKGKKKADNHMNLCTSAPVGSPSVRLKLMVWAIHRAASHRNYHAAYQKGYETMGLWVRRLDILSRCQMPVWAATWESCSVRQTWRKGSVTAKLELSR